MVTRARGAPGAPTAGLAVAAVVLGVALAGGCVRADYRCVIDADCDVGEAGRCELDHRCTRFDPTCATQRRYNDHAGEVSNVCFDDRVTPANLCAAGQPPAIDEACAANVCAVLPGCCDVGWSEACVQQAQLRCSELVCDTRIAITATKGSRTELWDLRWDGTAWSAQLDPRQSVLAWLAPAPATRDPQLVAFARGALELADRALPVSAMHNYLEATSVDFDRDGRPTAVLGYTDATGAHFEVIKLDDGTTREIATAGTTRLSWGDVDHDAFPDGIAAAGNSTRYHLLSSIEGADRGREIDDRVSTTMTGGTSVMPAPPPVRSFDWIDFDGDQQLDVVAYGFSVDLHLGKGDAIGTNTLIRIDCDPPDAANVAGCNQMAQNERAFAGAALPTATTPALVIATHPARALFRVEVRGTPATAARSPYTFPVEACDAACPPIIALVLRDLDGDHALDVVAIDADLGVYTALASENLDPAALQIRAAFQIPTSTTGFAAVRASVTGVPR
jgi:hypothetical protein